MLEMYKWKHIGGRRRVNSRTFAKFILFYSLNEMFFMFKTIVVDGKEICVQYIPWKKGRWAIKYDSAQVPKPRFYGIRVCIVSICIWSFKNWRSCWYPVFLNEFDTSSCSSSKRCWPWAFHSFQFNWLNF